MLQYNNVVIGDGVNIRNATGMPGVNFGESNKDSTKMPFIFNQSKN